MKPFSLHSVLQYRQRLEDTAVVRLIDAQRQLAEKESVFKKASQEYSATLKTYQKMQIQGINIEDLLRYEQHLVLLQEKIFDLSSECDSARQNVEQKRKVVISRSRDKKVLEQLQVRQDGAYQKYLAKKETSLLDEMAVLAHERKLIDP
ncbi:MAG: flagellar export protein FliJ [Desulfocapsaceae bacterium]|nr:flagellar export protein FliJ [Desulfocapsaceae bacterium]